MWKSELQRAALSLKMGDTIFIIKVHDSHLSQNVETLGVSVVFRFAFVRCDFGSVWVTEWPPLGK